MTRFGLFSLHSFRRALFYGIDMSPPASMDIHGTKGILQIPLPWRFGLDRRGSCLPCGLLGSKGTKKSKPLERGSANQAKSWWIWEMMRHGTVLDFEKWRWNGDEMDSKRRPSWVLTSSRPKSQHGGRNVGWSLRWPPRSPMVKIWALAVQKRSWSRHDFEPWSPPKEGWMDALSSLLSNIYEVISNTTNSRELRNGYHLQFGQLIHF